MKALLVANWKMNPPTWKEAKKLFEATKKAAGVRGISIVVVPPAVFLRDLAALNKRGKIALGVQHAHFESSGSFTGEISLDQASDAKASYVIIGHAERRARGETNDDTRKKTAAALARRMVPVLCVGEDVRDVGGEYLDVVREQITTGLKDVPLTKLTKVVLVYEPTWTIGKDTTMNPREMHEMAIFMRKVVVETYGDQGHLMTILYGGSVDSTNAAAMLEEGDVKGFLVGRASIDSEKLSALIKSLS